MLFRNFETKITIKDRNWCCSLFLKDTPDFLGCFSVFVWLAQTVLCQISIPRRLQMDLL